MFITKKLICLISLFCILTLTACFSLSACSFGGESQTKRAIIMLPGLEGSALFDEETGELCWALAEEVFQKVEDPSRHRGYDSYAAAFFDADEYGVPKWKMRAGNMDDAEAIRYSLLDVFKPAYSFFSENYGDRYDVCVFQYDWRESNVISAQKLERFISDNGYDEVVFLAHSMGGHVVDCYLQKESNMAKVKLFVPIAVPFYGSAYVYDNICIEYDDELYKPKDVLPSLFGTDNWQAGVRKISAPYQLMPSDETLNWSIFSNDDFPAPFSVDRCALSMAETFDYMADTFAWFSDETKSPLLSVKNTVSYYRSMYVTVDGVEKHVAECVPCEFIYGTGIATRYAVNADESGINDVASTTLGDNVVTVFSATLGRAQSGEETGDGLWRVDGVKHMSIPSSDEGMAAIKQIAKKYLG